MDDDLPKEGELLDISKKKSNGIGSHNIQNVVQDTKETKIPVGLLSILIIVVAAVLIMKGDISSNVDPEKVAIYKDNNLSIFSSMKSQLPYLLRVECEGQDPNKADCVHFVGTFRPSATNPLYQTTMDTTDKVPGASVADIEVVKSNVKVLSDNKRTTLGSRELFTFLIDSVTVPKVGEEYHTKIKCTEKGVDDVVCDTIRQ